MNRVLFGGMCALLFRTNLLEGAETRINTTGSFRIGIIIGEIEVVVVDQTVIHEQVMRLVAGDWIVYIEPRKEQKGEGQHQQQCIEPHAMCEPFWRLLRGVWFLCHIYKTRRFYLPYHFFAMHDKLCYSVDRMNRLSVEGSVLGRHYLRHAPTEAIVRFYEQAVKLASPRLDETDKRLLNFGVKHRWAIGSIDAGLAFLKPQSEYRHRLYIMFAILEASYEYHDRFLPRERNWTYFLYVMYVGVRSVAQTLIGLVLVKVMV